MYNLDWTELAGSVMPNTNKIPYGPNKHLFRKVAFDVFQLNSSPVESLWVLEENDDGQFLVAQYSDSDTPTLEVKSSWEALSDRDGKNVTLMYEKVPIQRFASSDYGFNSEDVHLFQQSLVEKLSSDNSFASKLLRSQSQPKINYLLSQFPELQSMAEPEDETESMFGEDVGADPFSESYSDMQEEPTSQNDKLDYMVNTMSTAFHKALQSFDQDDEALTQVSDEDMDYILNQLRHEIKV